MKIRTVDTFTVEPYAGNPAAVVLLEEAPSRRTTASSGSRPR